MKRVNLKKFALPIHDHKLEIMKSIDLTGNKECDRLEWVEITRRI